MRFLLRRFILSFAVLLLALFAMSPVASAHVLKEADGISAVLHIIPDDSPVAAEPTRLELLFNDEHNKFSLQNCNCTIEIKSGEVVVQTVSLQPNSEQATADAVATVTFPKIGVYDVVVRGTASDGTFPSFTLDFLIRVPKSAAGSSQSRPNSYLPILVAGISLLALVLIAYRFISRGGRYKTVRNTK